MSNLSGPDFITLQVRDLEVSRHFYAEVMGFKASPEVQPNAVAFATQPIGFAIRKAQVDLDAVTQVGYGIILWFKVEDAAVLYEHLKVQGVLMAQELSKSPFGKMFTLRDPDGYAITVHDGG
jgi:predicted enzyme related to lactoylglutathione lyase